MSLTDEFADWWIHRVGWEPRAGVTLHGDPAYGPLQTIRCRIIARAVRVQDPRTGAETYSSVQLMLADAEAVQPEDRITMPSPWAPRQPRIVAVTRMEDDAGGPFVQVLT